LNWILIVTTIIIINSTREKYTEILNTCSITKEEKKTTSVV
jgi:hypothetical protein